MEDKIAKISGLLDEMGFVRLEQSNEKRVAYGTCVGEGYGATNIFVFADQTGLTRIDADIRVPPLNERAASALVLLLNRLNGGQENEVGTFLVSTDPNTTNPVKYRAAFINSLEVFDFEAFKYVLQASFRAIQFALPHLQKVFAGEGEAWREK